MQATPDDRRAVERLALSVGEVAAATGLSRRSVERYVADGIIASVRVGRRRLIPLDRLNALFAAAGAPAIE